MMNTRLKLSILITLCFFSFFTTTLFAQITITGIVYDNLNDHLIGASVLIKGTTTGTVTNIDGKFTLESRDSLPVLVVNYTGFNSKEIKVKDSFQLTIRLNEAGMALSEVVVSASRPAYKKTSTASFATISSSDMASSVASTSRMTRKVHGTTTPKNAPIGYTEETLKSGTLTAGEINDFTKWDLWQDIAKEDLEEWQIHWQFKPLERYAVQLTNEDGFPVVDAAVTLHNKNNTLIYQAHTDNTGKAELWAALFNQNNPSKNDYQVSITYNNQSYFIKNVNSFQAGVNTLKLPISCQTPKNLDIMMVVDATGSMGDELQYLKTELADVINKTQSNHKNLTINLGSVVYRDHGEAYLTKKSNFSTDIAKTSTFLKAQSANGGGDHPEAVESALSVAIDSMDWSRNAVARLLFLVLDAPPHHNPVIVKQLQELATKAAAKGIKIIPITGSGIDKSTEYLMRCLALTTNGTYTFLTDDSGIGNPHIEPTTDTYKVELLNELLVRLIDQYTDVLDCESPIAALQAKDIPTDKTDLAQKWNIKIYPNPTTGPVTISTKKAIQEIFLTDISGKILARYPKWKKSKHSIHLGQFPSGFYFLQMKTEAGLISEKVLVNHQLTAGRK